MPRTKFQTKLVSNPGYRGKKKGTTKYKKSKSTKSRKGSKKKQKLSPKQRGWHNAQKQYGPKRARSIWNKWDDKQKKAAGMVSNPADLKSLQNFKFKNLFRVVEDPVAGLSKAGARGLYAGGCVTGVATNLGLGMLMDSVDALQEGEIYKWQPLIKAGTQDLNAVLMGLGSHFVKSAGGKSFLRGGAVAAGIYGVLSTIGGVMGVYWRHKVEQMEEAAGGFIKNLYDSIRAALAKINPLEQQQVQGYIKGDFVRYKDAMGRYTKLAYYPNKSWGNRLLSAANVRADVVPAAKVNGY